MIRRAVLIVGVILASLAVAQAVEAPSPALDPATVPDPEKLKISTESIGSMRGALKDALQMLQEARAKNDVVKLNCVNEKLAHIKGLLRISEQSDVTLQEAVAKRETSTAEHEFRRVTIAQKKVAKLRAEAEQCLGQLAFLTDENLSVEVEAPDFPPGDPTRPDDPDAPITPPPPASPTT